MAFAAAFPPQRWVRKGIDYRLRITYCWGGVCAMADKFEREIEEILAKLIEPWKR